MVEKVIVQLSYSGYEAFPIHRRCLTTAHCENFCLLRFRPWPLRSSLSNLVYLTFLRDNHVDN